MGIGDWGLGIGDWGLGIRSEEHTSELQSHYSISYAVFCLKKKRVNNQKIKKNKKKKDL